MKKTLKLMAALFVGAMFMGACQQAEEPAIERCCCNPSLRGQDSQNCHLCGDERCKPAQCR